MSIPPAASIQQFPPQLPRVSGQTHPADPSRQITTHGAANTNASTSITGDATSAKELIDGRAGVAVDTRTFRERAADFFKKLPGQVAGAFRTFGEKVSHAFKTLPERAREFFHKTADFFKQLPAKVADGFRSLGERMNKGFNAWRENAAKVWKERIASVANFFKGSPKNVAQTETASTKPIHIPETVSTGTQPQAIPFVANPLPIAGATSSTDKQLSSVSPGAIDSITQRHTKGRLLTATRA